MTIKPAVLPHNFQEITEKLSRVEGLVDEVQIDICDGVFGREKTWIPEGTEILPTGFSYEFDVMLNDWKRPILNCLSLGAKNIVAHVDLFTDEDMETLVSMVSPHNVKLGISVSNDKSLDFHADMIRKAKSLYSDVYIQIMGIKKIGEQGQFFEESTLGRIKALKQQFGDMKVQIDGGINLDSAVKVSECGADAVVVGSFIFGRDDAGGSLEELNNAIDKSVPVNFAN